MECSCAIDFYDGDCGSVDLQTVKIKKARKPHKCQECKREIAVGEPYEHLSYLMDGTFYTDKTCLDCLSAKKQFFPKGGYCPGGIWTDISEEVNEIDGEIPEACISKLTPKARAMLCDIIDEHLKE